MIKSNKKGITVLICTHNGEKKLQLTLQHLANQKVNSDLEWEILLVNNASKDNTREAAFQIWSDFKRAIPFSIVDEPAPGKDRAMDLGLHLARYKYVIVCDDDNWLSHTYVQDSFAIMEENPKIGMLGGMGIPAFEGSPPPWFFKYQTYYAVGPQNPINGEIKHFWPDYRFLWGAGVVINMEAYCLLKRAGFCRILTQNKYSKVARSEDLELCFAIWLTGYKLWYDKKLIYHHHITNDRLKWSYLMKIVKQSISAIHYLRPYNILIFTGPEYAPKRSYWIQYIKQYFSVKHLFDRYKRTENLKNLVCLILGRHQENPLYFEHVLFFHTLYSIVALGKGYDIIFKKVLKLQKEIEILHQEDLGLTQKKTAPSVRISVGNSEIKTLVNRGDIIKKWN